VAKTSEKVLGGRLDWEATRLRTLRIPVAKGGHTAEPIDRIRLLGGQATAQGDAVTRAWPSGSSQLAAAPTRMALLTTCSPILRPISRPMFTEKR
jgi:hypothetical protein